MALYPASETIKTSEDTKAALKTSIAPASLGIKVDRVRRVGNAGIIVQTRTQEDLKKLKAALPQSLKASELKGRSPLVVIRDLEGKEPSLPNTLRAVAEQNFGGDPVWTAEKMAKECRLAFRKSRHGPGLLPGAVEGSAEQGWPTVHRLGELQGGRFHHGGLLYEMLPVRPQ
jgi:hypothetical protein